MTESTRRLDAKSLRGLAHPLRIRILGMLRNDGPATATGLAARLGESSGTTSWHLRQLHEHGFIEEDTGRGSRRERWWKSADSSTELRAADFLDRQGLEGSLATYLHSVANENHERVSQFVAEFLAGQWGREWHTAVTMSDQNLPLTPAEARALVADLHALVERYRRPWRAGDVPVIAQYQLFPHAGGGEQA